MKWQIGYFEFEKASDSLLLGFHGRAHMHQEKETLSSADAWKRLSMEGLHVREHGSSTYRD